jgi:hypothetical protein
VLAAPASTSAMMAQQRLQREVGMGEAPGQSSWRSD